MVLSGCADVHKVRSHLGKSGNGQRSTMEGIVSGWSKQDQLILFVKLIISMVVCYLMYMIGKTVFLYWVVVLCMVGLILITILGLVQKFVCQENCPDETCSVARTSHRCAPPLYGTSNNPKVEDEVKLTGNSSMCSTPVSHDVNQKPVKIDKPEVQIKFSNTFTALIGNKKVNVLLKTGAADSMCRKSLLDPKCFTSPILGTMSLPIKLGNYEFVQTVLVVDDKLYHDVILGLDFCIEQKATIDFANGMVTFAGKQLEMKRINVSNAEANEIVVKQPAMINNVNLDGQKSDPQVKPKLIGKPRKDVIHISYSSLIDYIGLILLMEVCSTILEQLFVILQPWVLAVILTIHNYSDLTALCNIIKSYLGWVITNIHIYKQNNEHILFGSCIDLDYSNFDVKNRHIEDHLSKDKIQRLDELKQKLRDKIRSLRERNISKIGIKITCVTLRSCDIFAQCLSPLHLVRPPDVFCNII